MAHHTPDHSGFWATQPDLEILPTGGDGAWASSWDRTRAPYEGKFDKWPRFAIVFLTALLLPASIMALFFGSIMLTLTTPIFVKAIVGALFTLLAILQTYFSTAHMLAYRKAGGSPERRKTTFKAWAIFTGISFVALVGSLFVITIGWMKK